MKSHYLGYAKDGRIVARASNRNDFKFAAMSANAASSRLPSFAPSEAGALKNADSNGWRHPLEAIPVSIVSPAEYKAAIAKRGAARD